VADKKQPNPPQKPRERKRPDVSFNFGASAKPKKGAKGSSQSKAKHAGGGS
jgi:hypothetical protein